MSVSFAIAHTPHNTPSVKFMWDPASGPVHHYNVYVSANGGPFELRDTTPDTTPAYTLSVETSGTYRIQVQAADISGNTGPLSDASDPVEVNLRTQYTMTVQPGINVISVPLDPGEPWTLENLLTKTQAGFLFYYDGDDFQYYGGGPTNVPVRGGEAYVVTRTASTPVDVTFEGKAWSNPTDTQKFTITVNPGINLIGVPLKPQVSWTLRDFSNQLPIDFLFHYDGADFVYYAKGEGQEIPIRGGEGYIAVRNPTDAVDFTFVGIPWQGTAAPPAAPSIALPANTAHTGVFAVIGQVWPTSDGPSLTGVSLLFRNERTHETFSVSPLEDGRYHLAVFNPFDSKTMSLGDAIEVELTDTNRVYQREQFTVTVDKTDIQNHRLVMPPIRLTPVPSETRLLANYPNPFNPETWIPFDLAEEAKVVITIYDLHGQLTRTLDIGHRPAGSYQRRERAAYWDGRNEVGEPVASGIYFYTLRAGDQTFTRRMVLVK